MRDKKVWFMDDRHLKSFWNYHEAALRWFKAHQAAREYAINDSSDTISNPVDMKSNISKRHVKSNHLPCTARTSSNDSLPDVRQKLSSKDIDEDIDMSSEMIAFFRQTIEHRKQNADRSKEAKKYNDDNCFREDQYVMADKIGVYGSEKRSFQLPNGPAERRKKFDKMKELYGTDAEKILAMEAHLDLRFEQNYSQPGAHLWPNIPLKL
uniref:Pre-mRNA-splicing factor SYF2 n=1 Tax=Loa loa TaxID=7209 RepID=A0A1I7V8P4_LOALO